MKARRKSDGEIIEVEPAVYNMKTGEPCHKCLSDGHHYPASELDFNVDADDTVIQGWVARDKTGYLVLHYKEPHRTLGGEKWYSAQSQKSLPRESFPVLTWESEPQEVEIIIKRKKK